MLQKCWLATTRSSNNLNDKVILGRTFYRAWSRLNWFYRVFHLATIPNIVQISKRFFRVWAEVFVPKSNPVFYWDALFINNCFLRQNPRTLVRICFEYSFNRILIKNSLSCLRSIKQRNKILSAFFNLKTSGLN